MSKMKRAAAIVLAAAMTMGSTLTVFAADTGSGGTTGKGENEGHVDKELINVVLPTVPTGDGSPFEYITDPERLIQETKGARYEDYTFPDASGDTGVYFRVGEKEFSNTSETLKVINKSSCDMAITLSAKATAASDKDLKLATSDSVDGDNPLYLALKVGAATTQAVSATEAKVTKTISGTPSNFETQYTGSAYEYVTKVDAAHWRALEFSLTGKVYNGTVAAGTTAPTVEVTWAFEKGTNAADTTDEVDYEETAEPEIISISAYNKADPKSVVIKFSLGKGPGAVDADGVKLCRTDEKKDVSATAYSKDMENHTITVNSDAGLLTGATEEEILVWVVLTKNGQTVKELPGYIKIKENYDQPEIISISEFDMANPQDVLIKFSLGEGPNAVVADGVKLCRTDEKKDVSATAYSVDMGSNTIKINSTAGLLTGATEDEILIWVVLTNGGETVKELQGMIKINK